MTVLHKNIISYLWIQTICPRPHGSGLGLDLEGLSSASASRNCPRLTSLVGSNSIQCIICQKWVYKKCRGIKGGMSKVMKSFICTGCLNPVTNTGCTSVDISGSANQQLVHKFCYFGDMLGLDGDADAAVEARI